MDKPLWPKQFYKPGHTFGGRSPNHGDIVGDGSGIGVDIIDRNTPAGIIDKTRGRIHSHRCADNNHDISLLHNIDGRLYIRHRLLKEHDVRTHRVAIFIAGIGRGGEIVGREGINPLGMPH